MRRAERVAVALVALLATACPRSTPETAGTPTVTPKRGGTITLSIADELASLDPHLAAAPPEWAVARALHRGLYAYPDLAGTQGTVAIPDLALGAPVVAADERTVSIQITGDGRFVSGAPVAVADVVASLRRLRTSDRGIGPTIQRAIASVSAREGAVQVVATVPVARLLKLLAHPQAAIVPADTRPITRDREPEGAGPYRVVERVRGRLIMDRRDGAGRDPIRPARLDRIAVVVGAEIEPATVVLDPGPPDLRDPSDAVEHGATVATLCVRYLDLAGTSVTAAQRTQLSRAVTLLADIGTGPVASGPIPPILQRSPEPTRTPLPRGATPRFDLVVSSSPRDRAEVGALRAIWPSARIRTVAPGALYGGAPVGAGARVRTWCADWPDAAALQGSPATAATAIPLWWPTEVVRFGEAVRGFVGSAMFPRGDPTRLWLSGG